MNEEEIRKQTAIKRNIDRINNQLYDEYSDMIDGTVNGNTSKNDIVKTLNDYMVAISPFLIGLYYKNYMEDLSLKNKMNTDKIVKTTLDNYEKKVNDTVLSNIQNFSVSNIDKKMYNDLRNKGSSIIDALSIADSSHENHAIVSESLFVNSIDNLTSQIVANSDFEYNRNKLDADGNQLYTTKRWLWSNLEHTRHMGMDGTVVPIDEYFVVINDITGEEELLMYPRDENGSPANTYNCGCEISYGNEYYDLIDGTDFKFV